MTAFARQQEQLTSGLLTCEIKTINHRYLDININLSEKIRGLEMPIRELLRQQLKRGKVDCYVRYQANSAVTQTTLPVDQNYVAAIAVTLEQLSSLVPTLNAPSSLQLLQFPGVIQTKDPDLNALQPEIMAVIQQALQELLAMRAREGAAIEQLFIQRLQAIEKEVAVIKQHLPKALDEQKHKLLTRFAEIKLEINHERLEQEMLFFMQRIDVAEELDRLGTHLQEFQRIVKQQGPLGRRIDFLLQELNREANTLASKSSNVPITHAAVEIKVLLEQIREQVQNIE